MLLKISQISRQHLYQSFFFNKFVECILFLGMEQKRIGLYQMSQPVSLINEKKLDTGFYNNIKLSMPVFWETEFLKTN